MFGSTNPFGQSSTSPFGSQSVFGQNNTSSNNPFATNPFGGASPFNAQTGGSIFGGTSTGVFGATQSSSPLASTPSFGVSSTPAFGSSAPAFGASSTPAFGSSSSSFGGSSAFGQKPAFGGFGSTPTQTSPFGGTFQQTQSTFGSSVFGSSAPFGAPSQPAFGGTSTPGFGASSTPGFGASSTPAFGASSNPAFGATSNPAFGAASTPAFGATTTPAFGSSSSVFGSTGTAFGAPSTPAFGSGGAFGATSTPTFGAPSTSAFGATSSPLFGASSSGFGTSSSPSFNFGSSPSFGQSTSAFGSSPFGTTPSPFGAQTSAFGSQSNASAFGSPTFGQSSFGSQQRGSRVTGYSPTVETDGGTGTQPAGKLESISAMPAYKEKSHEELRWEDYQMGDKGGPSPAQTAGGFGMSTAQSNPFGTSTAQSNPFGTSTAQPNPFGTSTAQPNPFGTSSAQPNPFGTSTAQSSPFGTSTTFGQSSANPFSSSVSPNPFASKTNTFGTSPFGASTSAFNSSPFGSSSSSSLFGTPSTPSIFGGTTSASPFGANTTPSLFGSSSSPSLFGSSPSMFSAPGTTSTFSSNFNTQSAPLFQSTTPSFGLGQTPFGQSTPTFGQTSIFSTPSTGFGLSTSSTPSLLNTTNQSAFSSPFQTTQPAQTSGAFSFGNFGQTQAPNGFGGTFGGFGQSTFGQPSGSQNTMVMQPTVSNPFGTLPAMPQISIGRSGSSPSVQYGISSMPVTDKPSPVRVSSLLTPRHLSQRRINLPSRKYHPKKDAPMAPFYCDEEEAPNTPKADALFVPRENPRALVIHPSEKWPSRTSMEKSSLLKNTTEPVHNKGSPAGNDSDKDHNAKTEQKATRVQEDHTSEKTDSYRLSGHRAGEATIVNEHGADIEGLMPKLKHADYYTQPQIEELAAKERAEPGFCQHVKNFVIGRHGYGSIKFDGETDVRRLDLESLVQFNDREVVVYMDDSKKPPVGQGLNKPAEVSLLNIKCVDKKTGQQYTEGRRVEKYKEMLKKKAEEQGAEFVSYDPLKGEWRFRVKHFSRYSF